MALALEFCTNALCSLGGTTISCFHIKLSYIDLFQLNHAFVENDKKCGAIKTDLFIQFNSVCVGKKEAS